MVAATTNPPLTPVFLSTLLASLADADLCARHDRWVREQLSGLKRQMMDIRSRKADATDDGILIPEPGAAAARPDTPSSRESSASSSSSSMDDDDADPRSLGGGRSRG